MAPSSSIISEKIWNEVLIHTGRRAKIVYRLQLLMMSKCERFPRARRSPPCPVQQLLRDGRGGGAGAVRGKGGRDGSAWLVLRPAYLDVDFDPRWATILMAPCHCVCHRLSTIFPCSCPLILPARRTATTPQLSRVRRSLGSSGDRLRHHREQDAQRGEEGDG